MRSGFFKNKSLVLFYSILDSMAASTNIKLAELKAALVNKEANEAKALRIVENLIDNAVSKEKLLESCLHISRQHYEDITQERALIMNCGYPMCNKKILKIPLQKFHISLKYNKVFDISERKNFCSNNCFKKSKHLENQLNSSYDEKTISDVHLLTDEELSKPEIRSLIGNDFGTEVNFGRIKSNKDGIDNDIHSTSDELSRELKALTIEERECRVDVQKVKSYPRPRTDLNDPPKSTQLIKIEKCLTEWFTLESIQFLKESDKRDNAKTMSSVNDYTKGVKNKIPKDEDDDDYIRKVQSFYGGLLETPAEKSKGITEAHVDDNKRKLILPLVDSRSQNELRCRIVLDRLNLVMTELFQTMCIHSSEVKNDLRQLIHTFCLSAANISLKPAEWSVMAILLLQLLSIRNEAIRKALTTESSMKFLETLVISFGRDVGYLRRIADRLMDSEQPVKMTGG